MTQIHTPKKKISVEKNKKQQARKNISKTDQRDKRQIKSRKQAKKI